MSDYAFSRSLLSWTLADVSRYVPAIRRKKAWVWTSDRRTWEFHFEEFFDTFGASDAFDAKAKGWQNWLSVNKLEPLGPVEKFPSYQIYVSRQKAGNWSVSANRRVSEHSTSSA